jgi:hypothetical protein
MLLPTIVTVSISELPTLFFSMSLLVVKGEAVRSFAIRLPKDIIGFRTWIIHSLVSLISMVFLRELQ